MPVVASFCNPILDLVGECDDAWFDRYQLAKGGYTEYDPAKHEGIYQAMIDKPGSKMIPGGSGQNTCSIAAALLGRDAVVSHGMVGQDPATGDVDAHGKRMVDAAVSRGVVPNYGTTTQAGTGTSAVCIHASSRDRSMCTNLGATQFYSDAEIQKVLPTLKDYTFAHVTGFFVTANRNGMREICEAAGSSETTMLSTTLSAPFILEVFSEDVWHCLQYAQIISGNEDEWKKLGEVYKAKLGFGASANPSLEEVLKALVDSAFTKGNAEQPRICLATCGSEPTLVAAKLDDLDGPIESFGVVVTPVPQELIRDTNGCGDAFIGGVIAAAAKIHAARKSFKFGLADIAHMVELGHECAVEVLQHEAFQFEESYLSKLKETL